MFCFVEWVWQLLPEDESSVMEWECVYVFVCDLTESRDVLS